MFLVGKHDPVLLKEMLATRVIRIYLHDSDEYNDSGDEIYFSMGQCQFTFKDFLRHYCHELKLRADVFPMKRVAVDNTKNLDLNTSAKKGEAKTEKFSPYLVNSTYCVLKANLSYPIGSFNVEKELANVDESIKSSAHEEQQEEKSRPGSAISLNNSVESYAQEQKKVRTGVKIADISDPDAAIFERMIIILPYKAP